MALLRRDEHSACNRSSQCTGRRISARGPVLFIGRDASSTAEASDYLLDQKVKGITVMRRFRIAVFAAASTVISSGAFAQGTLSTQGFGYPPGQLSARVLGTGGGLTEFDF